MPPLIGAPAEETLWMNLEMGSWISSVHSAASPIGCFLSASFTDRYGRRTAVLASLIPLILSWIMMALAHTHWMILLARIMGGISVGFLGAPAQIFIAEIAEPHLRGFLIGSPFVAYSFGILLVFIMGWQFSWRVVAWAAIILPCIAWIALFFANESPAWLVRNRRDREAYQSMRWLRSTDAKARTEVKELIQRFEEEQLETRNESLWAAVKQRGVLKPLLIINVFNIFQILSGTFLVVFYAVQIIEEFTSGPSGVDGVTAAVLMAASRFIFTLIYCFILMYMKRRTMMNWMGSATAISAFSLGLLIIFKAHFSPSTLLVLSAILMIVYLGGSTCLFIMCGVGVGELMPAKVRGKLSGYIFSLMNFTLFVFVKVFPSIVRHVGIAGLFFIFSLGGFVATLIMYLFMPETKDRTLADIEDYFKQRNYFWSSRKSR